VVKLSISQPWRDRILHEIDLSFMVDQNDFRARTMCFFVGPVPATADAALTAENHLVAVAEVNKEFPLQVTFEAEVVVSVPTFVRFYNFKGAVLAQDETTGFWLLEGAYPLWTE